MRLHSQKRLAAQVLGVGKSRVWFDNTRVNEIKEAITKDDIRGLIKRNVIQSRPKIGISRLRAKKLSIQRRKGRRQGQGTRKGRKHARLTTKELWINKVRSQRKFLKYLKTKNLLEISDYRKLYRLIKGNAFRSIRHIKLHLKEKNIIKKLIETKKPKKIKE